MGRETSLELVFVEYRTMKPGARASSTDFQSGRTISRNEARRRA